MFVIPDFVTPAAASALLTANAVFSGRRRGDGTPSTDCQFADIAGAVTVARLAERVANATHDGYDHLPGLDADYVAYTVLGVGGSHPLHADAVADAAGTPNHTPNRVASAMLYLNDGGKDFRGGELIFPGLGVAVEPRAGTLVGFLCDWQHRHEVPRVTGGERHAVAFWFRPAILKPQG